MRGLLVLETIKSIAAFQIATSWEAVCDSSRYFYNQIIRIEYRL